MRIDNFDYELIINSLPGSFLMLAPDIPHFTILAASDAYLEATMTSRQEIIGKGVFEVFPDNPDDPETKAVEFAKASFSRVVKEKCVDIMGIRRHDIQLPGSGGGGFITKFWKPVNTPVFGPDGNVICIIHNVEDVTESMLRRQNELELQIDAVSLREARAAALNLMQDAILAREKAEQVSEQLLNEIAIRKNTEESLRTSETILHMAQQASGSGTWDWDIIKGTLWWTAELYTLFGLDPMTDQANFVTWDRILHPDDKETAKGRIEDALRDHTELDSTYRIMLPNGAERWIRSTGEGKYDENGTPIRMLGICQDVTRFKLTEESLHESEERYKSLFNTLIEGFCIIEMIFDEKDNPIDYRFLEINPVFEAQTGLQNVQGKLMSELAPKQETYWYETYGRIAQTGVPERFENEAKALGRWFEVSAYRVGEATERKVAILFNDITERKLMEQQVQHEAARAMVLSDLSKIYSESVFNLPELFKIMTRMVAEHIGDICIITEMSEDGEWLLPKAFYHPDLKAGEMLKDIFPNVPIRVGEGNVGRAASTGQVVKVSGIPVEQLKTMVKPEFWPYLERFGVYDYLIVPFKTKGHVVGTIGVIRIEPNRTYSAEDLAFLELIAGRAALAIYNSRLYDALQRSHAELEQKVLERTSELNKTLKDLSIEQKRFRDVLDMLPAYVTLMDQDYRFIFSNKEFLKRFGDPDGKRCFEHLFQRTKPCDYCHSSEVMDTGNHAYWEWEGPDSLTYNVSEIPFTDADGSKMILKIGSDITNEKRAEKDRIAREVAEQANRTKSEFLANISHEIRTPMNAIIGFSELLTTSLLNEKQISQIDAIRSSSKNLLALINDILDLSKIEAGKMTIQPEPVIFSELIADIEKVIDHRTQAKGIRFFIEVEKHIPMTLLLDEYRMRQILLNLLDNAIKFTDEGHVILILDGVVKSSDKIDLVISVEDTGIGIPENQQSIIFHAFSRQLGLPEKKYEGTGLGLTITLRLIELMGGTLKLTSQPGKGSTFTIYLPDIPIVKESGIKRKEKDFDIRSIHFHKARILIVDDNFENRKLLADILEHSPLEIIEAANGKEAIDLASKFLPDLILMDLRMPEMSGYEATRILKQQESTKNIPVIAISASPKIVLNRPHEKDIFDDFIMKPIIIADLAELLKKYLVHSISEKDGDSAKNLSWKIKHTLTKKQKLQIKELIIILENDYIPVYREVISSQMISKMELFGQNLGLLGRKYGSEIVIEYGQSICSSAESFNVELLMEKLKLFPEVILKLKDQISA